MSVPAGERSRVEMTLNKKKKTKNKYKKEKTQTTHARTI